MQRLNITNGDSAAGTLTEAGVEGKIIAWRDVLHEGPVDSSLSLEELSKARARFIAEQGWDDFAHVSGDFEERDYVIRHLDYFDEVVLWFEDDLYDQLQLIQLLDFFAGGAGGRRRVSLIVVDGYIPPLSAEELKKLDKTRPLVTAEQLDVAKRAWQAFGSPDPTSISRFLAENNLLLHPAFKAPVTPADCDGLAAELGEPDGWSVAARFAAEILPIKTRVFDGEIWRDITVDKDEGPRADTSLEKLAALKPAFDPTGTVTAGNSSPLNDGAAAVVLMGADTAKAAGKKPRAFFRAFAVAGVPPEIMGIGPVPAIRKLLAKTGLKIDQIDLLLKASSNDLPHVCGNGLEG